MTTKQGAVLPPVVFLIMCHTAIADGVFLEELLEEENEIEEKFFYAGCVAVAATFVGFVIAARGAL